MPSVSPAAQNIAEKHLNQNKEGIPNHENKSGTEKRGRGRPKKDGSAPTKNPGNKNGSRLGPIQPSAEQLNSAALDAQRQAAAAFVVSAVEMSGYALGGEDALMLPPEKTGMVAVYDAYLKAKNINDIPPGVALCLITGQYYARVLATPKAKPKVAGIFFKLKNKLKGLKNARSSRGNDRERENDTGKEAGKGVSEQGN